MGDLGRVVTGRTPPSKQPELFGDIYPFITPTDISEGERGVVTERHISPQGAEHFTNIMLPADAVAFVCIGSIGKMALTSQPSFSNQQINSVIVDRDQHDPRFVFYALRNNTSQIKGLAGGVATPIINKTSFSNVTLQVPPLSTQRRIASILSAYDDLIENNARRIAILEGMARRLYDEWFVQFCFPGHEGVPMVDSKIGKVPEGWELTTVASAVKRFTTGKKYNQKTVEPDGNVPVLDQGQSGVIGFHNGEPGFAASTDDPVIVFANHTCYQRLVFFPFSTIQNVIPYKSNEAFERDIFWLHHTTYGLVELNDYKGHWPQFAARPVLVPTLTLAASFGLLVRPFHILTYNLSRKNSNLRTQRDLLLPKLISGEIDVSEIGELTEEAAA